MANRAEVELHSAALVPATPPKPAPPHWLLPTTAFVALVHASLIVVFTQFWPEVQDASSLVLAVVAPLLGVAELTLAIVCLVRGRAAHRLVAILTLLIVAAEIVAIISGIVAWNSGPPRWDF